MKIINYKKPSINQTYLAISVLGKNLKLNIKYTKKDFIELTQKENEIDLILPIFYKNKDKTKIINISIEKLYNKIAETEIEYSMEIARHILGFAPEDYSIKIIKDNYYKCIKKQIIINPYIIRFNKEIINTTIIEAFCKIKYKPNSNSYKNLLNSAINNYELLKTNLKYKSLKVS